MPHRTLSNGSSHSLKSERVDPTMQVSQMHALDLGCVSSTKHGTYTPQCTFCLLLRTVVRPTAKREVAVVANRLHLDLPRSDTLRARTESGGAGVRFFPAMLPQG